MTKVKPIATHYSKLFTIQRTKKIYEAYQKGYPRRIVAELSEISEGGLDHWLQDGKTQQIDFELGYLDYQSEMAAFYVECRRRMALFIAGKLDKIAKAGQDPLLWKANAWLLGQADNALFGNKQAIQMTSNTKNEITIKVVGAEQWKGIASDNDEAIEGEYSGTNEQRLIGGVQEDNSSQDN